MMLRASMLKMVLVVLVPSVGGVFASNGDLIVNGNVGVGTKTPEAKLHVAGSIKADSGTLVFHCPAVGYGCPTSCIGQLSLSDICTANAGGCDPDTDICYCPSHLNWTLPCQPVGRLIAP